MPGRYQTSYISFRNENVRKKAERSHSPHVYAVRTNAERRLSDWQVNIVVAFCHFH